MDGERRRGGGVIKQRKGTKILHFKKTYLTQKPFSPTP
jgi:hypothetical protein